MNGIKYLKLNLKNKITITMVGFIIIILSLVYFIVAPTIKDIKTMGNSIEAQREDLEKKYIKGQSLKKLTENLNKIEPKLELLNQIFINKNRELEFITSLEKEANKNQIGQKINLSSLEKTENQNFGKTNLQLFTKGNFIKQLQYLKDLEQLNYYININVIELSPLTSGEQLKMFGQESQAAAGQTNLNMYISADTYWN